MGIIPRCKFLVSIKIEKLTRIPHSSGKMQVRWHVANSARPDARGRTKEVSVRNHQCFFEYSHELMYNLGVNLSRGRLRSGVLHLDVIWIPYDGKRFAVGSLELDIAQFAGRQPETLTYLLQETRMNSLLSVQLVVTQVKGPTKYTVPEFEAPVVNSDIAWTMGIDVEEGGIRQASLCSPLTNFFADSLTMPYRLTPRQTVRDIMQGGDGLASQKRPQISIQEHEEGKAYTEEQLRPDLMSWRVQL